MRIISPHRKGLVSSELTEWIQRKKPKLLKGDNLKIFNDADFSGDAFLLSSCEFFQKSGLSAGVSLVLESLLKEVKGVSQSKLLSFIPYSKH